MKSTSLNKQVACGSHTTSSFTRYSVQVPALDLLGSHIFRRPLACTSSLPTIIPNYATVWCQWGRQTPVFTIVAYEARWTFINGMKSILKGHPLLYIVKKALFRAFERILKLGPTMTLSQVIGWWNFQIRWLFGALSLQDTGSFACWLLGIGSS